MCIYQNGTAGPERSEEEEEEDEVKIMEPKICDLSCRRIKPVAWLVLLGDTLHNFADGLALGAAVAQSISLGLSTMVALMFHELPHELGEDICGVVYLLFSCSSSKNALSTSQPLLDAIYSNGKELYHLNA